jgi:hypothetical protein
MTNGLFHLDISHDRYVSQMTLTIVMPQNSGSWPNKLNTFTSVAIVLPKILHNQFVRVFAVLSSLNSFTASFRQPFSLCGRSV